MTAKELKSEYKYATTLDEFLRLHTVFCLTKHIDQVLDSDKIIVKCCECGNDMLVKYEDAAKEMFCSKCNDIVVTKTHVDKLSKRLNNLRNRMMFVSRDDTFNS